MDVSGCVGLSCLWGESFVLAGDLLETLILRVESRGLVIPLFDHGWYFIEGEYFGKDQRVDSFHEVFDQSFVVADFGSSCKDLKLGIIFVGCSFSLFELS